jgi:hypothetical protein
LRLGSLTYGSPTYLAGLFGVAAVASAVRGQMGGVVVSVVLAGLILATPRLLGRFRAAHPKKDREPVACEKDVAWPVPDSKHRVAVHDARPLPTEEEQWDPYFVALCSCGWLAEPRDSAEAAFRDAAGHDANVAPMPIRQLG